MSIAKNSAWLLISQVIPLLVSIVAVPIYIGTIGIERYGALLIAWVLLGYFGQADFGIGRAITQRLAALPDAASARKADAIWSALASTFAFSLLAALLLYILGGQFFASVFKVEEGLRSELLGSLWLLALCVPVVALGGVLGGALMGSNRFGLATAGSLTGSVAMQVLPLVVALTAGARLEWLIGASLAARIIGIMPPAAGVWTRNLRGLPMTLSRSEFSVLTRFGAWVMVSAIVSPLMISSDRFVIGSIAGAAAVAAYSIPFQIAARTVVVPQSFVNAVFPRFASEDTLLAQARCWQTIVFVGQAYAPLVVGIACLAAPLLHLWLGESLDSRSILIGQIVLAGFWANAVANVPYSYLQARGNPRFTALLHVLELPAYVALLFVFGSRWGLAGFAAAYSLRCLADCLILLAKAGAWRREVAARLLGPGLIVLAAIPAGQAFQTWPTAFASAAVLAGLATAIGWLQMPLAMRRRLVGLMALRRAKG